MKTNETMHTMTVHAYEEGCGFNATIIGTQLWRSRYPMNAYELCVYVERNKPAEIVFTGDVLQARAALGEK